MKHSLLVAFACISTMAVAGPTNADPPKPVAPPPALNTPGKGSAPKEPAKKKKKKKKGKTGGPQTKPPEFSVMDVALGQLKWSGAQGLAAGTATIKLQGPPGCEVEVEKDSKGKDDWLIKKKQDCEFWRSYPLRPMELEQGAVKVTFAPKLTDTETTKVAAFSDARHTTIEQLRKQGAERFATASNRGELQLVPDVAQLALSAGTRMLVQFSDGHTSAYEVDPTPPPRPPRVYAPGTPLPVDGFLDAAPELSPYFDTCKAPARFKDHYVVCVDALFDNRPVVVALPRSGHVLRPNNSLLVLVRHQKGVDLAVTFDGTRGLYKPKVNDQTSAGAVATQALERGPSVSGEPPPVAALITAKSFGPRTPGHADLKVQVTAPDPNTSKDVTSSDTVEFEIEETYSSALRVGLGIVGGGAVDREYAARLSIGSGQREIAATTFGNFDLELVIGFAPYLDYFRGGRGYAGRENLRRFPFGFSPYIGLGVINGSKNSLELLKSVHLGVEWEPMPSFSIAATWVGRRVTQLASGEMLGSPTEDPVATKTGFDWGWGIVLNISPEFLRIAQKPGSSLFSGN